MTRYRSDDSSVSKCEAKKEIKDCLQNEGIILTDNLIGTGTYSNVCVGFSERFDKQVAVKLIDTRTQSDYVQRFMPRELQLIPFLKHPNVIKSYQICKTASYVAIVQEYGENGDLLKLIKKLGHINELDSRFLFRQLIEAIIYLENLNIVHRDLKCENIFLDCYSNVKLGDFGFARILTPNETSDTHCGSKAYVAVELLRGRTYSGNAADIWSAGVVLFIMLTGRMPYNDKKPKEMILNQLKHRINFPEGLASAHARELIRHMVHPRHKLRATTHDILACEWLKKTKYFMRSKPNEIAIIESSASSTSVSTSRSRHTSIIASLESTE